MKKILVIGATGFLGGHILNAFQTRSDVEVIAACRTPEKLPAWFAGEVRAGDLLDAQYRRAVLAEVDVVCNAGGWGSFWGHKALEYSHFYLPTKDLIDQAIQQGVNRFIQASTLVIGPKATAKQAPPVDDFSLARQYTGFWPHVDFLMDLDRYMRHRAVEGTQMMTMRLGHFVGVGNSNGLLPMLLPRLKTHLVPWLAGGQMRMPLVTGEDMGRAFVLAATAEDLADYESFNICGPEFSTMREFFHFLAEETGLPTPHYSVPYPAAYAFGWLMETLNFLLPGDPFLMRSIVFVSENWVATTDYARQKLGYIPQQAWREAVRAQVVELKAKQYPWPHLEVPKLESPPTAVSS
jgi:nucleoside-diphosphate-sugar epimerase